jgi:hypothetical protein
MPFQLASNCTSIVPPWLMRAMANALPEPATAGQSTVSW